MKQLFFAFILALLLSSTPCFSQPCTNLVFNQALLLATPTIAVGSVTYTVPAGKVWKIESIMIGQGSGYCAASGTINWYITKINGVATGGAIYPSILSINSLYTGGGITSNVSNSSPKWMFAGHSIELSTSDVSCAGAQPKNYLSVIEFNCTP